MPKRRATLQKSEYGQQLAEKQAIRGDYGLRERQFRHYFDEGKTPETIFSLLESRLDSIVFRGGLTATRPAARQLVGHGHVLVNGRRVTIPSYRVRVNDIITTKDASKTKGMLADYTLRTKNFEPPAHLSVDSKNMTIKMVAKPDLHENVQPLNFQTVIEFYSR